MARRERDYLGRMVRTHPVRTVLFTVGPIVFGLLQFFNSFLNDGSILFALAFCVAMGIFSAMVTRYHLVTFRLSQLTENIDLAE
ncbi:hypothetical protein OB920_14745 [Halobacteria archaeon HArc-gm2]|nr:hypothetical protein [Halobacteria archaeon HArc-gm2]